MKYSVTDNREGSKTKGKKIEFDWHMDSTPTDADMEEVFGAVYQQGASAWGGKKPFMAKAYTAGAKGILGAVDLAGGLAKNLSSTFPSIGIDKTGKPMAVGGTTGKESTDKSIDQNLKALHDHLDKYAQSPDSQPEGIAQGLLYGLVEFAPQAPVFGAGSPVGAFVESGLSSIAKKFSPAIATKVANELPAVMAKSLKYGREVAKHAAGQGVVGGSVSLAAGQSKEKAAETAEGFAIASAGFKILKDMGVKIGSWAKTNPNAIEANIPKAEAPSRGEPRFTELPAPKPKYTKQPQTVEQQKASLERAIIKYNNDIESKTKFINDPEGAAKHAEQHGYTVKHVIQEQKKIIAEAARKQASVIEKLNRINAGEVTDELGNFPDKAAPIKAPAKAKATRQKVADELLKQQSAETKALSKTPARIDPETDEVFSQGKTVDPQMEKIERHETQAGGDTQEAAVERLEREGMQLYSLPFLNPKMWKASLRENVDSAKESAAYGAYKSMRQKLYEFTTTDSTPVGNRFGVGEEQVAHAAARLSGRYRTEELLSRKWNFEIQLYDKQGNETYRGPAYKSEEFLRIFELLRTRDNVLAGYDTAVENHNLFSAKVADAKTRLAQAESSLKTIDVPEYDLLGKDKLVKKIKRQITSTRKEIEDYSSYAEKAYKESQNIKSAVDALFKTEENPNADGLEIYDNYVKKWMSDSQVYEAMERWLDPDDGIGLYLENQWRAYKRLSGEGDSDYSRGRHSGIRAQLRSMDLVELERPLPKSSSKPSTWTEQQWNEKNQFGKDKHDQRAKFTGTYSTDLVANLADTIGGRNEKITKADLVDKMIETGTMTKHGVQSPKTIQGENAVAFPYTYPVSEKIILENGKEYWTTKEEGRIGYIPESFKRELTDTLGMNPKGKPSMVGQFINTTQMAGILDAIYHGNNLVKVVQKTLGVSESEAYEVMRRLPYFGKVDAMARIGEIYKDVLSDTPAIRERKADLAERGLLRTNAHYQEAITNWVTSGLGRKLPDSAKTTLLAGEGQMNKMAEWLFGVDTASRMILDDAFTVMARKGRLTDTPENRRKWIEQVGQYNDRLMGPLQRSLRNYGLAPFVVAGRTMNRNARRALTGYVGAESPTMKAEIQNRMMGYFGAVSAAMLPLAWNLYLWNNALGPEGNAPVGTLVLSEKDKYGKNKMVNFFADSFFQRGLNLYLGDYLQGVLTDTVGVESEKNALEKALAGRMHPWAGPFPQAVSKALPGDFSRELSTGRKYGYSDDTLKDKAGDIAAELNPLLFGSLSSKVGRGVFEKKAREEDANGTARALKHVDALVSPFIGISGYKESTGLPSTAMQLSHQMVVKGFGQMSKDVAESERLKTEMRAALKKDRLAGMAELKEIPLDKLTVIQKQNIIKSLDMTKLQRNMHNNKIDLAKAYKVFDAATKRERKELGAYLVEKAVNRASKGNEVEVMSELKQYLSKYSPEEVSTWVEDYKRLKEENKIPEEEPHNVN